MTWNYGKSGMMCQLGSCPLIPIEASIKGPRRKAQGTGNRKGFENALLCAGEEYLLSVIFQFIDGFPDVHEGQVGLFFLIGWK